MYLYFIEDYNIQKFQINLKFKKMKKSFMVKKSTYKFTFIYIYDIIKIIKLKKYICCRREFTLKYAIWLSFNEEFIF